VSDLLDPRGCLTPAGVRAVLAAPPGQAPTDLAAHIAACHRCQQRLLFGDAAPRKVAAEYRPRLGFALAIVLGGLLVALLGLLCVRYLITPRAGHSAPSRSVTAWRNTSGRGNRLSTR